MQNIWMYGWCVSDDCAAFALFDNIRWRALNENKKRIAPKITPKLYLCISSIVRIFFSFYTHAHACNRLSIFLLFSPSPVLSRSHGTHRSGTMVALYSTAALAEFGLAPAKRYSRCSRHVEFIVADRSINRFWPLFPVMVACEAFKSRVEGAARDTSWRRQGVSSGVMGFFYIFFDFNMFMKKYNMLFF